MLAIEELPPRRLMFVDPATETWDSRCEGRHIPCERLTFVGGETLTLTQLRHDRHGITIDAREQLFHARIFHAIAVDRVVVRDRADVLWLVTTKAACRAIEDPQPAVVAEPRLV